ncbi:integrin alpha-6-like isoform X1 [Acipenser oxyrinchus oxyrinchus]|uniref:Integrin alpha-6-like isoform X1 n=1 Tax=Acipenser oxyrinchus oxyrinchus TaxID=40147 RepID=A0AAD8DBI3_ACIOX|nr:integrin alpha-6-like isoform X1 [Acipenser oxyrinchus oxyrinchus]
MAFSAKWILLYLPLICFFKWTVISAFNLDTENVFRKNGEPGSLFGFSLAMHRQLNPTDQRILLVGAPKAKSLSNQKANITGGLYSCQLNIQQDDCRRVIFDNDINPSEENKENQWMGVTVQSQGPGGKIVTCAHRYEKRQYVNTPQESRDIIGRCYVLSEDLTIKDDMDGGGWKFCESRLRGHEGFGSCQQGLSATFTKDYHYIIFGAPGTYNWKGVVRVEQKNYTLLDLGILEDGPYEVGDETRSDENLVPVPANSYLGFSLDSGTGITNKESMTFVSGAPRANHNGAVVFLKKDGLFSRSLSPEYILEGEGLASSFGYDVAVVDLNSDGWKDIVVGAPQFFVRDGEIGGAVYVYINNAGKWDDVKPTRLNGTKDSMFGLAVENIGDINQDGFEDIAVGAPYDGGSGKVFIYHGSKSGVNTKAAQILDGQDFGIKFFGYSLAGNMDLDENSYPDIAVGSLSDALFIFRAKPVISIKKTIETTPARIDLETKNCLNGKSICMSVQACFEYTANPSDYSPRLTIAYTFEAESDRKKMNLPSRVTFLNNTPGDPDYQHTGSLDLRGQNKKECVKAELKLQDNIKDKLCAIPITVAVEIKQARRKKRQAGKLLPLVPVLNSNDPSTARSEVNFLKEGCGSDNICQSKLKLEYKFCSRDDNDNFTPLNVEDGLPVIALSQQKDIALEITVTNVAGDDAHEAKLTVTFPDTLSYSASRHSSDKQLICSANQNGSRADCELGNPFKRDSKVTFYVILSTTHVNLDTTDIEIDLKLDTTSVQTDLANVTAKARVIIELLLSVSGVGKPSQVYFGGSVKGEAAMKMEDEVGSLVEYEFRIINLGKPLKSLDGVYLDIQWPKEISNGKWLLYLMKVETKHLDNVTCTPTNEINPRRLLGSLSSSRKKRDTGGQQTEEKLSLLSDKRKYLTLDCGKNVNCVTLRCPLQGLDSNAEVVLRSRLWNSTFLEEYSKLNYLDIIVKASININATKNMILRNANTQVRVTVFPEKTVAQYTGVPWWIILVAILAGILMLALLVFLLWKCGFFKRSKYADSVPSYNAVRIRKEERQFKDGKSKDKYEKKQWKTTWNESESYS